VAGVVSQRVISESLGWWFPDCYPETQFERRRSYFKNVEVRDGPY